jgi:hypothetical protein
VSTPEGYTVNFNETLAALASGKRVRLCGPNPVLKLHAVTIAAPNTQSGTWKMRRHVVIAGDGTPYAFTDAAMASTDWEIVE